MIDDPFDRGTERTNAQARLRAPAICFIVISTLNLLLALWMLLGSFTYVRMDDDEFQRFVKEQWNGMSAEQRQSLTNQGWTFTSLEQLLRKSMAGMAIWMSVCAVFAVISILGGVGMLKLRWRGLAITGTILTTIPALSCMSCVLIGEGIGIWCMVVLFNSDVTAGFAANRPDSGGSEDVAEPDYRR